MVAPQIRVRNARMRGEHSREGRCGECVDVAQPHRLAQLGQPIADASTARTSIQRCA